MTNVTMDTSSFNSFTPKEPQTSTPRDPAPLATFITFLPPQGQIWNYLRHNTHLNQADNVPKAFLDAMSVREKVYVQEQGVALENEFDDDDHRSCHWVLYASINSTPSPSLPNPQTGTLPQPRNSTPTAIPIGTIRLVPFPHPPHPRNGGIYLNNHLTNPNSLPSQDTLPQRNSLYYPLDFPTTFHNGREPYLKLGRLAVIKEYRGRGIAGQLVRAAIEWMQAHHAIFNPSLTTLGLDRLGIIDVTGELLPKWGGLFCIHAQEGAIKVWEKYGFRVDEKMGKWWEEGIPHVGMWLRVEVGEGGHTVG